MYQWNSQTTFSCSISSKSSKNANFVCLVQPSAVCRKAICLATTSTLAMSSISKLAFYASLGLALTAATTYASSILTEKAVQPINVRPPCPTFLLFISLSCIPAPLACYR
jgi:hypothetical protein